MSAMPVAKYRPTFGGDQVPVWIPKGRFTERNANRVAREALSELLAGDFVETFGVFRAGIDFEGLGQAVAVGGDVGIAEEAIQLARIEGRLGATLVGRVNEAIAEGAELGLRFAPPQLANVPTHLVTELAASFVETEGAALIAGITESTKAGIRQALLSQLTDQVSPTQAAQRIGDLVGLRPDQVKTVNRFRSRIEAQLLTGVDETAAVREVIETRVRRESARQLRIRGQLIADTEMQAAIQHGERGFWQVAADTGEVDPALVIKTWITVDDGDVCPICMPMHGNQERQDDSFSSPEGWVGLGPPAHPRCRCYLEYAIAAELAA